MEDFKLKIEKCKLESSHDAVRQASRSSAQEDSPSRE
jgi:hypothetical protein